MDKLKPTPGNDSPRIGGCPSVLGGGVIMEETVKP